MAEDTELVRKAADAFGRALTEGEIEPYVELLDPDVDFESASAIEGGRVRLRGRDEVRGYLEQMTKEYTEVQLEPRELRELAPGRFLVLGSWHGRARGAPTTFVTPLATILELRDGMVVRVRGFMDEQQAREAIEAGG